MPRPVSACWPARRNWVQSNRALAYYSPYTANSTAAPVPVTGLFSYSIVTGAYNLIFTGSPSMPNIDTFGYRDASFYPNFLQANHPLMDATSPDLSAFQKAGGLLIVGRLG